MQIYKEIKILNARPTSKNIKKITHHLYGFHSVKKKFSTGQWLKKTIRLIKEIKKKGVKKSGADEVDNIITNTNKFL